MNDRDILYMLALKKAQDIGDITAKKLLAVFGTAENVFAQKDRELQRIEGFGSFRLKGLRDPTLLGRAEKELDWIQKNGIRYISITDSDYPLNLSRCADSPIILFYKGNIDFTASRVLSIVGTRQITTYGQDFIKDFISGLAPLNPVIVSGFAYGVDIHAHLSAMKNGLQTIACLGHGLNRYYPRTHQKYAESFMEKGGFVTEFWSEDVFDRNNFLGRNRIIAGLSEATIVIESAEKGGALVTAQLANSYNREVFAVPGRIGDKYSTGCNYLIRNNQALLLTQPADIIFHLNWELENKLPVQKQLFVELNSDEQCIYEYLKGRDKEMLDTIAIDTGIPNHRTASLLLEMELKGVLRPLPGKFFSLV